MEERAVSPVLQLMQDASTSCDVVAKTATLEAHCQTEKCAVGNNYDCQSSEVETQTDFEYDHLEPRVLSDSEIAESLWLMPSKDTAEAAVGNDDDYAVDIDKTPRMSEVSGAEGKVKAEKVCDSNKSVEESFEKRQETDVDFTNRSRTLGQQRAAIVRKLLTETKIPQPNGNFVRGCASSRSCRMETRKGDSLQYITDQYVTQDMSSPSTPQMQKDALKEKVVLKKEPIPIPSKVTEPIAARIPRPKISRYSPVEAQAQSPDEEAEVADRLTPLRSEMRTLRAFSNSRIISNPRQIQSAVPLQRPDDNVYDAGAAEEDTTSSDSEGSYDTNEIINTSSPPLFDMTKQLREALEILKHKFDHIPVDDGALEWATKYVQHEWLKTAARRTALAQQVEGFIEALKNCSNKVLLFVVNLTDQNENTALHYAVSHGNFDVVSVILDSGVCQLDKANKAGYTAVMLAALCDINDEIEAAVIKRLFQMGNVNTKAAQHGQTALMLAVSHGKINTTRLLLHCGADLNIQDEEGSTALMCAAEHGQKDIVKLLLAQPSIDASISDCDSSTALSIAVENRHRDIGVLIYAHLNYARNEQTHHDSLTTVH
uniref:ANK_REP_REGION domain-containing protein n=1 Tax=Syphacia muris TaxID=451379 RepID=A0A0N5B147_9BILA